jgi:hypothetical protein
MFGGTSFALLACAILWAGLERVASVQDHRQKPSTLYYQQSEQFPNQAVRTSMIATRANH